MSGSLRDSAIDHFNETISLMQEGQNKEALEELEKAEEAAKQAEASDVLLSIMSIKGELLLSLGASRRGSESLRIRFKLFCRYHFKRP